MTHSSDLRIYFSTWQLAAFSRFCALRHFDLQFLGFDQVKARDAEPSGSDLLNRAVFGIAIRQIHVALRIFATFASVALSTDPVHRHGERFVRFFADRSVTHRAGFEAQHDTLDR